MATQRLVRALFISIMTFTWALPSFSFEATLTLSNNQSITINLKSDAGEIFPSMSTFDREGTKNLEAVRPLASTENERQSFHNFLHPFVHNFGYGHVEPYVASSLITIFQEISNDDSILRKKYKHDAFFEIPNLSDAILNVRVFTNALNFKEYLEPRGAVLNSRAYYDAEEKTLAVYLDFSLFRHFGYQSKWDGYTEQHFISELSAYVHQLILSQATHEVIHYLQDKTSSPYFHYTPIREGMAALVASEMSLRFYIQKLSLTETWRSEDEENRTRQCNTAPGSHLFEPTEHRHYLAVAEILSKDEDFSVLDWFFSNVSDIDFHRSKQETNYSKSLVFTKFLTTIPSEAHRDFEFVRSSFEKTGDIADAPAHIVSRFDSYFRRETLRDVYYTADATVLESKFESAMASASSCMQTEPTMAMVWALQALSFSRSSSPEALLHIGDILFNARTFRHALEGAPNGHALLALRFYRMALIEYRGGNSGGFVCPSLPEISHLDRTTFLEMFNVLRVHSRIGEVYTSIGSIDSSIKYLECAIDYSNRLADAGYNQVNIYFFPSLIAADMELITNDRTRTVGLQFSKDRYAKLHEFKVDFKRFSASLFENGIGNISPPEVCLAYLAMAISLTHELGLQEEAAGETLDQSWTPKLRFCGN